MRPKASVFDKYGFSRVIERSGQVSRANVAYVGFNSYNPPDIGLVVGVALIRSLMKRHFAFEYTHDKQFINPTIDSTVALSGSGPNIVHFYYVENDGAGGQVIGLGASFVIYDPLTGTQKTLSEFGLWFRDTVAVSNSFGYDPNGSNYQKRRLIGYRFESGDYTNNALDPLGGAIGRRSTLYPLERQYLKLYSYVTFKIQNTTAADNEGTLVDPFSTDRSDVNPIVGRVFEMGSRLPIVYSPRGAFGIVADPNARSLQFDADCNGVIFPDNALTGNWLQVPTTSMFEKVIGSEKVYMNPGNMRTYTLSFKFDGTLLNLLEGHCFAPVGLYGTQFPFAKHAYGKCKVVAVEKVMPGNIADESNAVTINFRMRSSVGCVFGKRLGAIMPRSCVEDVRIGPDVVA